MEELHRKQLMILQRFQFVWLQKMKESQKVIIFLETSIFFAKEDKKNPQKKLIILERLKFVYALKNRKNRRKKKCIYFGEMLRFFAPLNLGSIAEKKNYFRETQKFGKLQRKI